MFVKFFCFIYLITSNNALKKKFWIYFLLSFPRRLSPERKEKDIKAYGAMP